MGVRYDMPFGFIFVKGGAKAAEALQKVFRAYNGEFCSELEKGSLEFKQCAIAMHKKKVPCDHDGPLEVHHDKPVEDPALIGSKKEKVRPLELCTVFAGNPDAVQKTWAAVEGKKPEVFRKRGFLYWYTGKEMDAMEFTEAESNMNDLVSEYQQYQDATAEEEGQFDEDEEFDADMM